MPLVILPYDGTFSRGELRFVGNEAQDVKGRAMESIADDIGPTLCLAKADKNGVARVDRKATDEFEKQRAMELWQHNAKAAEEAAKGEKGKKMPGVALTNRQEQIVKDLLAEKDKPKDEPKQD